MSIISQAKSLFRSFAIGITDAAAMKIKDLVQDDAEKFLRIGIETGGCSGFRQKFSLDSKKEKDDKEFSHCGARVVLTKKDLAYIDGSTVNYVNDPFRSFFELQLPFGSSQCSCGDSFALPGMSGNPVSCK
ncbi:FeS cluster insertion protein like protein [Aduncisulcus paluster]|uniref:FeS cluster insertion protein like protein n=1 Tax=Aduncisulcus paluster TaxID=2918883 RepID=A0ABQ5KSU5_9EUKA|nr:FeS cluster insertion protein like protein [Aduncisulcus paluster]